MRETAREIHEKPLMRDRAISSRVGYFSSTVGYYMSAVSSTRCLRCSQPITSQPCIQLTSPNAPHTTFHLHVTCLAAFQSTLPHTKFFDLSEWPDVVSLKSSS